MENNEAKQIEQIELKTININFKVRPSLKARMEKFKINWSKVNTKAIEAKLKALEAKYAANSN